MGATDSKINIVEKIKNMTDTESKLLFLKNNYANADDEVYVSSPYVKFDALICTHTVDLIKMTTIDIFYLLNMSSVVNTNTEDTNIEDTTYIKYTPQSLICTDYWFLFLNKRMVKIENFIKSFTENSIMNIRMSMDYSFLTDINTPTQKRIIAEEFNRKLECIANGNKILVNVYNEMEKLSTIKENILTQQENESYTQQYDLSLEILLLTVTYIKKLSAELSPDKSLESMEPTGSILNQSLLDKLQIIADKTSDLEKNNPHSKFTPNLICKLTNLIKNR